MLRTIAGRASPVLGADLNCPESGWAKSSQPRGRIVGLTVAESPLGSCIGALSELIDRGARSVRSENFKPRDLPRYPLYRPGRHPELHRDLAHAHAKNVELHDGTSGAKVIRL